MRNIAVAYDPLKAGAIGSNISCIGSPARGVIWVENNGPVVFQSPVGTEYGYFKGKIPIFRPYGTSEILGITISYPYFAPNGAFALLEMEPIAPAFRGRGI